MKKLRWTFFIVGVLCLICVCNTIFIACNKTPKEEVTKAEPERIETKVQLEKTAKSEITIRMLAKNKKVIPIYYKYGDYWNTNIKLPDVVVVNNTDNSATVKEIGVTGKVEGREVVKYMIYEDEFRESIINGNKLLNKLTEDPNNIWRMYNLGVRYGNVSITGKRYKEDNILAPSEMTSINLSTLLYFNYEGRDKVNEVWYQITIDFDSDIKQFAFPVPLTPYTCKGDYIFPVKGSVTVVSLPYNDAEGHRGATSQEFAIDIVDYRRFGNNRQLSLSAISKSAKVTDYFAFHRDVLAIGDGVIVAAGNSWPDKWMENPQQYSVERVTDLTLKLLEDGMDFIHALLANYVIIDHQNGEFSLYCHMSEGTVVVKPGDIVKQGQVIGKIGNTGNSTDPHLHFQLMDSKDFLTANGLPVMFKDVPAPQDPMHDYKESNSLLFSDYIFLYIPE